MSGVALKFASLAIRTLSKPIANFIKHQAREHEGFRKTCVSFAQSLHRLDMRLRLGLLQDAAAIERQVAKEAAEAAAKKHKQSTVPTVKTEAQVKAEEKAAARAKSRTEDFDTKPVSKPRIRPLSEAKAVESGATFISEAFLFSVAGGLIIFESWRSRRKETSRREDVADRINDLEESEKAARRALVELEREVLLLRAQEGKNSTGGPRRILPRSIYEVKERGEQEEETASLGWLSRIASFISSRSISDADAEAALVKQSPGPAETILMQSNAAIDAKHRAIEEAQKPKPDKALGERSASGP